MPTVRLRDASEYPERPPRGCSSCRKLWFNYDFPQPPAMSRVMAWDPEFGGPHGRAMKRAMAPGEFSARREGDGRRGRQRRQRLRLLSARAYCSREAAGDEGRRAVVRGGARGRHHQRAQRGRRRPRRAGTPGLPALGRGRGAPTRRRALFAEIRAFYAARGRAAAVPPGGPRSRPTPADVWAAVRRAFADNRLARRLKEALAFAVSLTSRSPFGTALPPGRDAAARAWASAG